MLLTLRGKSTLGFEDLVKASGLAEDQVRRANSWLSSKGLVEISEESTLAVPKEHGEVPELALLRLLEAQGNASSLEDLRKKFKSGDEFSAAVGRAAATRWIGISSDKGGKTVKLLVPVSSTDSEKLLRRVSEGGMTPNNVPKEYKSIFDDFVKRKILSIRESKSSRITITDSGKKALEGAGGAGQVERLTPEILSAVRASHEDVRLRPIDVTAPASGFYPGRRHPVKEFINEVREVYLSMGFAEITGNSIQSSFWNFDALFTPQDHPARELQDTFYLKGGRDEGITRSGVVARVAAAHENGGDTGSKGWRYSWDVEEARRLVLRTHNTALTIRATMDSRGAESRVFSVGRVYRNENLDFKHLAELHQMEGIVIGEGLNLRHLMGVLTKFYGKLGMSGVKLWPSFFPYTEPSMQVMVYYEKVGRWLEMGGSGIFRPEVTTPLGVTKPVLAWGCGLERLLMLRLGIQDIRELYNNDLEWLRERRDIASAQNLL